MENSLEDLLKKDYSIEEQQDIFNGFKTKKYTTFRINTLKATEEEVLKEFKDNNIIVDKVEFINNAYLIKENVIKNIRELNCYKNGLIYLQSLSSMLPVIILNPKEGETILDMAAAPGSKTTQIAMLTNNLVTITALEKNKIRKDRLLYNLNKQGVTCTSVLNIDATTLDEAYRFDKILLDAPCSGSGTLTVNSSYEMFTEQRLTKTCKTELALLKKALKVLKPNGYLLYSTCSILKCENEEIIKQVLSDVEIIPITLPKEIKLLPSNLNGVVTILPTEYFEGFFMCLLKKKDS